MRSALPCALALAATAVFAPTASASPGVQSGTVPFATSHYDRCLASATSGELAWRSVPTAVAVTGTLSLRDPQQCAFPSRPTAYAIFTAYHGRTVVDAGRASAPVGGASYRLVLSVDDSPTPVRVIDRVTVQVCHTAPVTSTDRLSCGPVESYPVG